jgi:hypothetical protein
MADSTGNEPKHVGNRPTKGVTGITGHVPEAATNPQAVKTTRGVQHTPMHSDTPSGKGEVRHY